VESGPEGGIESGPGPGPGSSEPRRRGETSRAFRRKVTGRGPGTEPSRRRPRGIGHRRERLRPRLLGEPAATRDETMALEAEGGRYAYRGARLRPRRRRGRM
jgi:hypothetical protein